MHVCVAQMFHSQIISSMFHSCHKGVVLGVYVILTVKGNYMSGGSLPVNNHLPYFSILLYLHLFLITHIQL